MARAEMHNFNFKFMQLWNAGHDARLTVECRDGKSTINLQLTLGEPPPACHVRPQPRRPGPSRLRRRERCAEARTAAENAADTSEATDNSDFGTAAVNTTDITEAATFKKPIGRWSDGVSEKEVKSEAFKKPPGKLSTEASEIKSFKKPPPLGTLTGKTGGSRTSYEAHS